MSPLGAIVDDAGFLELWTQQRALLAALLAALCVLALIARPLMRRRSIAPLNDSEERAWSYCPRCGWPRGGEGHMDRTTDTYRLPSALLRRGWCREPAVDADGRVVLPNHPSAVAFTGPQFYGLAREPFLNGSRGSRGRVSPAANPPTESSGRVSGAIDRGVAGRRASVACARPAGRNLNHPHPRPATPIIEECFWN